MSGVAALFALRIRLLTNRLKIGTRAGRVGMSVLRGAGYLLALAFLRFETLLIRETADVAGSRFGAHVESFFFESTLMAAMMVIFVVNLLVFAAEEFDTSDSTRDTGFLLSLPLTVRQVVWAKALLRSTVDVYGLFLLLPLLWALVTGRTVGVAGIGLALALFLAVELIAIFMAFAVFLWTSRVVAYHRMETLRVLLGLVLPSMAFLAALAMRGSVTSGSIERWASQAGWLTFTLPTSRLVHAVLALGAHRPGLALVEAAHGLLGVALVLWLLDRMVAIPRRALSRVFEGMGRATASRLFAAALSRVTSPLWLLVGKDLVLLARRPVFVLTSVIFPLSITAVNLLLIVQNARSGHAGPGAQYLEYSSMYVTIIVLSFMGAAQSFGQTEQGHIPFLQGLPVAMHDVMRAKVLLFTPMVIGAALAVQVTYDLAFHRLALATTCEQGIWTILTGVLATHVAVSAAALFPLFEFGVLAVRGANMAIGGMLHLTVSAALGLLLFPLSLDNKLIIVALTLPMVVYLWRKGAERLCYFDEGGTLSRRLGPQWDEAYILFGLYTALQVVIYISLLFVLDLSPAAISTWSMDLSALSLVALGAASLYYLAEKETSPRGALKLAPEHLARGIRWGLGAGAALLTLLPIAARAILGTGGGGGIYESILHGKPSLHIITVIGFMAIVLAPIAEEVFFRGVLYGAARRTHGRAFATLASALLFALLHWDRTMVLMVAFGLVQVLLYEASGTLFAPIVAHGVFNAGGLTVFSLGGGLPPGFSPAAFALLHGLVLPAALAAVIVLIARRPRLVTGGLLGEA